MAEEAPVSTTPVQENLLAKKKSYSYTAGNFIWGGTIGRLALGLRMTFIHAPNRVVQFFLLLVRNIVSCLVFLAGT